MKRMLILSSNKCSEQSAALDCLHEEQAREAEHSDAPIDKLRVRRELRDTAPVLAAPARLTLHGRRQGSMLCAAIHWESMRTMTSGSRATWLGLSRLKSKDMVHGQRSPAQTRKQAIFAGLVEMASTSH